MIVDENMLGANEAKNSAECFGLTWVDPDEIVDSSAGGEPARFMRVQPFREPFDGWSGQWALAFPLVTVE